MARSPCEEKMNAYRILEGKSEGNIPVGRPMYMLENNIKTKL
jgi:hypothetical protein